MVLHLRRGVPGRFARRRRNRDRGTFHPPTGFAQVRDGCIGAALGIDHGATRMSNNDVAQWLEQWVESNLGDHAHVGSKAEMHDQAKACVEEALAAGISVAEVKDAAGGDLEATSSNVRTGQRIAVKDVWTRRGSSARQRSSPPSLTRSYRSTKSGSKSESARSATANFACRAMSSKLQSTSG